MSRTRAPGPPVVWVQSVRLFPPLGQQARTLVKLAPLVHVGGRYAMPRCIIAAAQERSMGVNPPSSKNNVVQNYEIQKQQVKKQNSSGDSTKVPNFNAEKYISEQKIKTLGL